MGIDNISSMVMTAAYIMGGMVAFLGAGIGAWVYARRRYRMQGS